jgi:hypothetical protein
MRLLAPATQGQLRRYLIARLLAVTTQGHLRIYSIVRLLALTTQGQLRMYSIVRLLALTAQGRLWRRSTNVRFPHLITQGQLSMKTVTPAKTIRLTCLQHRDSSEQRDMFWRLLCSSASVTLSYPWHCKAGAASFTTRPLYPLSLS